MSRYSFQSVRAAGPGGRRPSAGLSLTEVMIAAGVMTALLLPLLWFAQTSARGTFSSGQHLLASQAAAGMMDTLLALPFGQCLQEVRARSGPKPLAEDPLFRGPVAEMVTGAGKAAFEADFARAYRSLQLSLEVKEEQEDLFLINLQISWLNQEGNEASRQTLRLEALKFRSDHEI